MIARILIAVLFWAAAAPLFAVEDKSIQRAEIESAILARLSPELTPLGFSNVQVRFIQFPEKFTCPAGSDIRMEELAGHRRLGVRRYKISAVGERGARKSAFCSTAVSAEGPDIRARYHIPAGKVIAASDLDVRRGRLEDLPTDAASDPSQVVGQEANRNIAQGERLELDFIRQPFAVMRGEIIEVELSLGGIQAKVFGEAQTSGFVGDQIPFKNTLSLKRFFAKITGPRQAQVTWAGGANG